MASNLPILHSKHDVIKLSLQFSPSFEKGTMWSMTSLVPSAGVLPQYWQVKLSLSKIANLSRKFPMFLVMPYVPSFLRRFRPRKLPPLFRTGKPASCKAFAQEPKAVLYAWIEGKQLNLSKSLLEKLAPHKSCLASCNFSRSWAFEYDFRPRFMEEIIRGFNTEVNKLYNNIKSIKGALN